MEIFKNLGIGLTMQILDSLVSVTISLRLLNEKRGH